MSGQNSDQLHRTTLAIYTSIMEQFNPGLQRLAALGNNYIQAFQALALTSEAYFNALSKMGEQAMQSMSSRLLGKLLFPLIISFPFTLLNYSRTRFCQTQRFLIHKCQREALKEEERRYRFLAKKHSGFTQSIAYLMNKRCGELILKLEKTSVNITHCFLCLIWQIFLPFILGPSPQPSRSNSISGLAGGKVMRALVPHPPSANSTLLPFSRGETITLLVKEPRNGWLFGRSDSSGRQGWFPAAYVGPMDEPPGPPLSRLVETHCFICVNPLIVLLFVFYDLYSRSMILTCSFFLSLYRGTNPFATVKLKPTKTNDRSAPHV
uniref:BAR/IMD domain containing adaptor protein 2 like 2a n=1 Tax=Sinocyclocheilus rhinocerous TaxID=307959 RepID=A0A673MQY9_9TELE